MFKFLYLGAAVSAHPVGILQHRLVAEN